MQRVLGVLVFTFALWLSTEADAHKPPRAVLVHCPSRACDQAEARLDAAHRRRVVAAKRAARVRAHKRQVIAPYLGWLSRTRRCEWDAGQRWQTNTGNGFYGAYQFTLSSWASVGGIGTPHLASPLEQSYRAVLLRQAQGVGAWPICGS